MIINGLPIKIECLVNRKAHSKLFIETSLARGISARFTCLSDRGKNFIYYVYYFTTKPALTA
nr:MAG TPA: hypothetical protein [Caudoviricetes sp.]